MLYDIFYTDRSFDRATRLPARAERGAYAVNLDWDGHIYVARRGKWVDGRRTADGRYVPADQIVVGDLVEAGKGDDHDTGRVAEIVGRTARVGWRSGVTASIPVADLTRI